VIVLINILMFRVMKFVKNVIIVALLVQTNMNIVVYHAVAIVLGTKLIILVFVKMDIIALKMLKFVNNVIILVKLVRVDKLIIV